MRKVKEERRKKRQKKRNKVMLKSDSMTQPYMARQLSQNFMSQTARTEGVVKIKTCMMMMIMISQVLIM